MTPASETIPAMPASDVTFADHEIAFGKTFYVIAHAIDHAHEFMADGDGDGDRLLGLGIPVIYMYVGPADGGLEHADQDVIAVDFRHGHILQPESRFGFRLYDGLHRFSHGPKLAVTREDVDLACC